MKKVLVFLLSSMFFMPFLSAQEVSLELVEIMPGIYEVRGGSGANCGLVVGAGEVVLIDAKMTLESARALQEKIAAEIALPLTRLIISHSDGDHVNGLPAFPAALPIISHRATRREMEESFVKNEWQAWLPDLTYEGRLNLYAAGRVIELHHFGPAHTSGDSVIFLPAEKLAFVGDLIFLGREPLIHRHKGGSARGVAATLQGLLDLGVETVIHGHGNAVGRAEISELLAMYRDRIARVQEMIKAGKSLDQVKQAFGIPVEEESSARRRWPSLVEVIYLELTEAG
jgi:cyclase